VSSFIEVNIKTTAEEAADEEQAAAANPEYEVTAVTPLKESPDSPLVEARFVDPVTITASVTLALIAVRLVNHWLKRDERGVQIDLRTTPATISHLQNVPAGVLVIIDKDGKATVQPQTYEKPEDLLPTLTKIFG
jgi:cell pole-organizing protein PopZ